ncbi:NAD(P)-dependent oxidoreductase [Yinghuangia sp. YIM S09857]|uniref:NAD(P)-dependent oxidoreductase n=1 Tax=Yinghuangia sp. YIM S09857 TaxID=3436929 RepID=UPI003F539E2B
MSGIHETGTDSTDGTGSTGGTGGVAAGAVAVFGAGGRAGRAVVAEAVARGYAVTAVVRDPSRHADLTDLTDPAGRARVALVAGDVTDPADVARAAAGHAAAVSAAYTPDTGSRAFYGAASAALVQGLAKAGVGRLVHVGIATTVETEPGVRLMDAPGFPEEWREFARGHADAIDTFTAAGGGADGGGGDGLDWLVVCPPMLLDEADRTGTYRIGGARPVDAARVDVGGHISYADLALAVVDEIARPTRHRTVAAVSDGEPG